MAHPAREARAGSGRRTASAPAIPRFAAAAVALCALASPPGPARAQHDVSAPAILQWFEASYETIERRTADLFLAGYGAAWLPPPGRAEQGDLSVGYDPYDRFDLGRPRDPTLYGTETGLRTVADTFHRAGVDLHVDTVINHAGFADLATDGFVAAGGYPGLAITLAGDVDGDFHSAFAGGDVFGRLAGLVDIAHEKNHTFIRHPVDAGDPRNIPLLGTTPFAGRLANVPTSANRRFYPDRDLTPIMVYDPATGQGDIPIHPFNLDDPLAGDPTEENAMGYLMRYLQWMVQDVGADGLRIDAAKHVEGWVLDYVDRAVYRQNPRRNLDGSPKHVFSYCEAYTGDRGYLQTFVKKTIDPAQPGVIGGNRDVLDFPLHFALRDNLTGSGYVNNWHHVRDAAMDTHDDGMHNGSQGVMFVQSHDDWGPELSNVAHAYVLMHPGSAVVYLNGREFGEGRDFPKLGRGDALGGVYGDYARRLVEIRNTHGRGNYCERWIEKEIFAFERCGSAIALLSNRTDPGFDSRTVPTSFAPGTPLIELTGAAADAGIDPWNDIPELLVVNGDGTVNCRFLRNTSYDLNMHPSYHRTGALIYGLSGPQAPAGVELEGVSGVLPGGEPNANDYENGITRLADLHVATGDTLQVALRTEPVYLLGSHRDVWADGDNALLRLDGGVDVNGSGDVDFTAPGTVSYGFERFTDKASPLIGPGGLGDPDWHGDGEFVQAIDTTKLAEGTHYLEVRAFRHRTDDGPAIYSSFKKVVYVDRLPPVSAVEGFQPFECDPDDANNQDLLVRSVDKTADAVHVFLDEPAATPDAELVGRAAGGQGRAGRIDRDLFAYGFFALASGNHVATVVTFEQTDRVNVQRFAGLSAATPIGRGVGDLDLDGALTPADLSDAPGAFEEVLWSRNTQFHAAADVNGDGLVDTHDLLGMQAVLTGAGAAPAVLETLAAVRQRRSDVNLDSVRDAADHAAVRAAFGESDWLCDLDADGTVGPLDGYLLIDGFGVLPEPATRWQGASGAWSDANGWTAGVPGGATGAHVDDGRTVTAAGEARARNTYVGIRQAGTLVLSGAVLRTGSLHVGPGGAVAADAGSEIHLTGDLLDLSTRSGDVDLAGTAVRFDGPGGRADPQLLEAAGADRGLDPGGWSANHAIAELLVEPGARVRLVDLFDNPSDGNGNDALYVGDLVLAAPGEGTPDGQGWIDLDGLALYYRNGGAPKRLVYADADLNGDVDFLDYVALKRSIGAAAGALWADGDTDGDGDVDRDDFLALRTNFECGPLSPATAPNGAVPEPATLMLLAAGAAVLAPRRRRARPAAPEARGSSTSRNRGRSGQVTVYYPLRQDWFSNVTEPARAGRSGMTGHGEPSHRRLPKG